ncbi:MAG: hypothetical protein KatS3mg009_0893 [Acidimicrobiia bacterium]|nr:MAG: hypothetical protein KatS3mg009_0893 [Acidimicrobiia bacterium]
MTARAATRPSLRWGRAARVAVVALLVVAFLFLFVFPTRSFLAQRREISDARRDLQVIREQNDRLEQTLAELSTPAEIERRAKELQMAYPGEIPYARIPAPTTTTTTP